MNGPSLRLSSPIRRNVSPEALSWTRSLASTSITTRWSASPRRFVQSRISERMAHRRNGEVDRRLTPLVDQLAWRDRRPRSRPSSTPMQMRPPSALAKPTSRSASDLAWMRGPFRSSH